MAAKQIKTVYPVEGRLIRVPGTRTPVPEGGMKVEMNPFWQRCLNDGDVTLKAPGKSAAEKPASSRKTSEGEKE